MGNNSIFFRRSFFPFNALGMPTFNNSVPRDAYEEVNSPSKWLSSPVLETHCESDDHQLSDDPAGSKSD